MNSLSLIDSTYELKQDAYIISLMSLGERKNGSRGGLGFLLLETLDEHDNSAIYKIDFPFGIKKQPQASRVSAEGIKKIKSGFSQTYRLSREKVENSELYALIKTPTSENFDNTESSSIKAQQALTRYFNIHFSSFDVPQMFPEFKLKDNTFQWNPFTRLVDNKKFPFSRLQYSGIWQRIKDAFLIFNGSFYQKNNLGLLDYIFPIPRILINLLAMDIPFFAKFIIAPFAILTMLIKIIASALISLVLTPVIGLIHLTCTLMYPTHDTLDDTIKINPIDGELESISDLQYDKDLSEPINLGGYKSMCELLTIKPLAKDQSSHCEEISFQRPIDYSSEKLVLGVYADNIPKAIIEINDANKPGIFNLMRKNKYNIDTNLDETNARCYISG